MHAWCKAWWVIIFRIWILLFPILQSIKKYSIIESNFVIWIITWQKTNELKIRVFNIKSESGPTSWNACFPLVCRYHIITNWYSDCPKIFLHITLVMKFPFLPTGVLFIKSSLGGSVANARAPRVSMIMLTQRSWTAVRGALPGSIINPKQKKRH